MCGAALFCEKGNAVSVPLNFLTLSVLVSVVRSQGLQPVSHVLGFSQSYLVHK